ncbi:hypothetical protein E6C67_14120 [Azospirillum sp. TSA2s]|uniref:hypothetical protein n=1 Tax=Azospirillum sp. TSA2s TaxID=709810 RepID=UPI0010A9D9CB|nr:hypothetical protein [Azospirillum sp. TSA2s]QCG94966.1 hypothetical protein E6C67_14120 [Azospirillum sp. TSA2s]
MSLGDMLSSLFGAGGQPSTPPAANMPSATPDDPATAMAQLMKEEQASRPYDLLLKLGLGLMASKNPSFAGALGEAGASALQGQEDAGTKALKRYMLQQQVSDAGQKATDRQTLRRALAGDKSLSDAQRTLIMQNPDAAKEYLKRSMGSGLRLMDGTVIGGGPMGGTAAPEAPATVGTTTVPRAAAGDFASLLAQSENGGRIGGFNKQGYGGKYQFGEAALENAGVYTPGSDPKENAWLGQFNIPGMPEVRTAKDFFGNEAAQDAAFGVYRSGLEKEIAGRGLDQFIGQTVGGVPITKDGILAMMHLGGPTGAERFLTTGGQYNPADSNGTKLSDYAGRFGRVQVADAGTTATDAAPAAPTASPAPAAAPQRYAGQGVRSGGRLQPVQDANGNIVSGWGYNPQTGQVEPLDEGRATNEQKDYEAAVRGGYPGTFFDYQRDLKKAGKTEINMTQSGEKKGSEKLYNDAAEAFSTSQAAARTAQRNKTLYDDFGKAIEGFRPGAGADTRLAAGQILQGMGINVVPGVSEGELAKSIGAQLELAAAGMMKGQGQITENERAILRAAIPSLTTTLEGNRKVIDLMKRLDAHDTEVARVYRENARKNGGIVDPVSVAEEVAALGSPLSQREMSDLQRAGTPQQGGKSGPSAAPNTAAAAAGQPSQADVEAEMRRRGLLK